MVMGVVLFDVPSGDAEMVFNKVSILMRHWQ